LTAQREHTKFYGKQQNAHNVNFYINRLTLLSLGRCILGRIVVSDCSAVLLSQPLHLFPGILQLLRLHVLRFLQRTQGLAALC
jgi:hypothetical protein